MDLKSNQDGSYTVGSLGLEPATIQLGETPEMQAEREKWAKYWAKHDADLKANGVDLDKSVAKEVADAFSEWVATLPAGTRVHHPVPESGIKAVQYVNSEVEKALIDKEATAENVGKWNFCPHCGFKIKNDSN